MVSHIVKQGECVSSIAFEAGLPPDLIWNDPENAALRNKRKDQHILFPGDELFIPDKTVSEAERPTDSLHRFVLTGSKEVLSVRFINGEKPKAGEAYSLSVDGDRYPAGKLDSEGGLRVYVPANAKRAVVTLGLPADSEIYTLLLGHLDPIEERSGIRGRLANLGYLSSADSEAPGDLQNEDLCRLQQAIKKFQMDQGLLMSSGLDQVTRETLQRVHGC